MVCTTGVLSMAHARPPCVCVVSVRACVREDPGLLVGRIPLSTPGVQSEIKETLGTSSAAGVAGKMTRLTLDCLRGYTLLCFTPLDNLPIKADVCDLSLMAVLMYHMMSGARLFGFA